MPTSLSDYPMTTSYWLPITVTDPRILISDPYENSVLTLVSM